MSNTVFTICKYHKVGSPVVKAVLLCMADFASDDGSGVWCSKGAMASDLELGETSVRDAVKTLLRMGLISEVGQRNHEQGYTFEYKINIDAIWNLERTRKRTPLDKWVTPAPCEPLREANPYATRRGPLRHTKGTPSPRETKPLITINNLTTANVAPLTGTVSTVSEAFDVDSLQAQPHTRIPLSAKKINGCGSRTPIEKDARQTTSTGAADCTDGCGSRTQVSKEYTTDTTAASREATEKQQVVSDEFYAALLQTLGAKPIAWWAEKKGKAHVAKWLAQGLTEVQILAVASRNAALHAAPPDGPKGLDSSMKACAVTAFAPAPASDANAMLADWVNSNRYLAPNAIGMARARELIALKLVSPESLTRRGIAF